MKTSQLSASVTLVIMFAGCSAMAAPREGRRKAQGKENAREKAAGWDWKVARDEDEDLRIHLLLDGKPAYSFRIGAGGAIVGLTEDLREKPVPLLSPSAHGEHTDRIIQWTAWCDDILGDEPALSKLDRRFNITQGGSDDGTVSEIGDVIVADGGKRVEVYAVPQDQWKRQQQKQIKCKLSALTRYDLLPDGILKITRFVRVGEVTLHGREVGFTRLYVEAWTPFRRAPTPSMPSRAAWTATACRPWSTGPAASSPPTPTSTPRRRRAMPSFSIHRPTEKTAIGVVFGRKPAEPREPGNVHLFNMMNWDDGIGVLPGVTFHDVQTGSIIEQTIDLVARPGLAPQVHETLAALADGAVAQAVAAGRADQRRNARGRRAPHRQHKKNRYEDRPPAAAGSPRIAATDCRRRSSSRFPSRFFSLSRTDECPIAQLRDAADVHTGDACDLGGRGRARLAAGAGRRNHRRAGPHAAPAHRHPLRDRRLDRLRHRHLQRRGGGLRARADDQPARRHAAGDRHHHRRAHRRRADRRHRRRAMALHHLRRRCWAIPPSPCSASATESRGSTCRRIDWPTGCGCTGPTSTRRTARRSSTASPTRRSAWR